MAIGAAVLQLSTHEIRALLRGGLVDMGCCFSAAVYFWSMSGPVTGVEASHVCAEFWQTCFEVCILEPLLNHHFINHHLRVPEVYCVSRGAWRVSQVAQHVPRVTGGIVPRALAGADGNNN